MIYVGSRLTLRICGYDREKLDLDKLACAQLDAARAKQGTEKDDAR